MKSWVSDESDESVPGVNSVLLAQDPLFIPLSDWFDLIEKICTVCPLVQNICVREGDSPIFLVEKGRQ